METKTLKINIPEGYEVDKEKSTFEEIVFKRKENTKPKTWEEFAENYIPTSKERLVYNDAIITPTLVDKIDVNRNYYPNEEIAQAFIALRKLIFLRKAWVGDWRPDWKEDTYKYTICVFENQIVRDTTMYRNAALSFPTAELRNEFRDCFKNLLEKAKILL